MAHRETLMLRFFDEGIPPHLQQLLVAEDDYSFSWQDMIPLCYWIHTTRQSRENGISAALLHI